MKTNQLKPGVVLSYINIIVKVLISLTFTPVMLRLLGQSEYGLYTMVASVVSNLTLLTLGFGSAYVRYYSIYKVKEDKENIAKLNGMFITVFTIMGIVVLVAGMLLSANVDVVLGDKLISSEQSTARILMIIMSFNIAISFPASVFNSYITANEEYVFQKLLMLINTIASPLVMLPLLLLGYGSVGVVISITALSMVIEVSNIIYCFRKLNIQFLFKKFDFALMKDITVFSSYIFISMIVDQINWNLDKFIIGRFWGTITVAIYGVASQINTSYMSFSTNISSVFIPRVNRMVASDCSDKELTDLFTRIGRVQFIVVSLICTAFIFFGRPFMNMWAGADYDKAYVITLILIIPVTIPLIQNVGIEIQRAKNMHKFRSQLYLIIAIVNIAISIPLTKYFAGVGAALGTSLALLIGNGLIMNIYYQKNVRLNMKYFWCQILKFLPALIAPVIFGLLIALFVDLYHPVSFLISGIVYVIIFVFSIWFFGMNQYEKELVRKPVLKILKKLRLIKK